MHVRGEAISVSGANAALKDAIAKGIFNQGQVSASTRNLLAGVPNMSSAKVMPNPPSGGATETVTELKAEDLDP